MRTTPVVQHGRLQPGRDIDAVLVGSPAWYTWLDGATAFAFRGEHGAFMAHKERRGHAGGYWKAYRKRAGRLYRAYLGISADLTLDHLNAIAAELTRRGAALPLNGGMQASDEPAALADTSPAAPQPLSAEPETPDKQWRLDPLALVTPATFEDVRPLHLLITKLTIPSLRPNLVPRPHLLAQLDAAIGQCQKLILLSAPAGFGKTTLLTAWLNQIVDCRLQIADLDQPNLQSATCNLQFPRVAWFALDDGDNHLGQFLAYLIAALETVYPGIGAEAWALLRAQVGHPPTHAILSSLVNALAATPVPIMLALDDYHTISLQVIHDALVFLLDHMPSGMHIIIASRADPPLPLARLRARGELIEVRAADLRFTTAEATHLFDRVPGLQLSPADVTTLASRTEGWVTGLQLAALALQQNAAPLESFVADFSGSHRYVFDYLAEEVFRRQPAAVQDFLTQTAILSRLCGPLCAAVTGQDDAQTLLEHLDQANLFLIRLDSHRQWYRYHHLFRDFLRARLDRAVGPAGRAPFHRRASAWFEQHGLIGEAVEHASSAQAWADVKRCITSVMESKRFYESFLDWPGWLAALPDAVLQADPDWCLRLARIAILTGHAEVAERPMSLAEAVWNADGNQPKVGEVLRSRAVAFYFRRDLPRAMQVAQQALAMLPAEAVESRAMPTYVLGMNDLALGHVASAIALLIAAHEALQHSSEMFYSLAAAQGLAQAFQLQGRLQYAAALHHDVIRRAGGATHQQVLGAYIYLGLFYYERNDLAAAEQVLREGLAAGERTGRGRYWPFAYSALTRVLWARGDAAQASAIVEQSLAAAQLLDSPPDIAETQAQQAWLWLAQGDLAAAERWLAMRALNADDTLPYERQAEHLMFARIRIAQELRAAGSADLNAVVRLLDRLCQAAEADERMLDRIAILTLMALTSMAQHDLSHALEMLSEALMLAEPEGYIRTFVDEGAAMHSLLLAQRVHLPAGASGERMRVYIDRLLAAFPLDLSAAPAASTPSALLSERERSVLQLIAGGRSVQEIATLLVISVHTVRTHLKRIYAKLEVHSRLQALKRARALQLL
jgi:LuxR family maltose regulon positive regulatory protein